MQQDLGATTRGGSSVAVASRTDRWVLLVAGAGDVRSFAMSEAHDLIVGRGPTCRVVLDHDQVSRCHARLRVLGGGEACVVEDLGSRNGTRVGELLPAHQPRRLRDGDAIAIGPFTLIVQREVDLGPRSALAIDDPAAAVPTAMLVSAARSTASVLICGESGAGKQVLAETMHRLSGRPGRLISINCAAIGSELLESELFGHERGAFTGAVTAKPGLLELAGAGTVLFDEIGDMPAALQAKLLHAVESREVLRVGGTHPVAIAARFLSATHRDLRAAVDDGAFRLDLYYRLATITVAVPPLRERRDRIVPAARELLAAAAARDGRQIPALSSAAIARLRGHDWPGNVRELRNVLERALIVGGDPIEPEHLLFDEPSRRVAPGHVLDRDQRLERERILDALAACQGNQTRAAKQLGIARSTLVTKLALYRIPRPRD